MAISSLPIGQHPNLITLTSGATLAADINVTLASGVLVALGATPDDFPIGVTQHSSVSGDEVLVACPYPIVLVTVGGTGATRGKWLDSIANGLVQDASGTGSNTAWRPGIALATGAVGAKIPMIQCPAYVTLNNVNGMS